jgi:hypothetical protein
MRMNMITDVKIWVSNKHPPHGTLNKEATPQHKGMAARSFKAGQPSLCWLIASAGHRLKSDSKTPVQHRVLLQVVTVQTVTKTQVQ